MSTDRFHALADRAIYALVALTALLVVAEVIL